MSNTEKQSNKTIWDIQEGTLHTWRKARKLEEAIKAACDVPPEDEDRLRNYTHYLADTRAIEPPPTARASLCALAAFISIWEALEPAAVWEFYQKEVSARVLLEWTDEWTKAQSAYDADPAELPLSALTPSQREEAETPGSPLTSPALPSPNA